MSNYRRATATGACYFFTLVSYRRQPILCDGPVRAELRAAISDVRAKWPFTVNAWVLLPDHLHCIWTLPVGDNNYPTRWSMIKRQVSLTCRDAYRRPEWLSG